MQSRRTRIGRTWRAKDEAKARTLAHAVFVMLTVTLDPKRPVVAWLAQWAALTVNVAEGRLLDGRAASEKRSGHAFKRPIA